MNSTEAAQLQLDRDALREFVERKWNDEIVPALTDYIAVPAKSPGVRCRLGQARLSRARGRPTPRNGPSNSRCAV